MLGTLLTFCCTFRYKMDVQRDDDDKRMRELLGCLDAMRGMLHAVCCMPAVCCSFSMRCALPSPLLPAAVRRCNALQQTRYSISGFQVRHFDTTGRVRQRIQYCNLQSNIATYKPILVER